MEVRLLVGPDLYFPRPAAKLTLDVSHLLTVPAEQARAVATALGLTGARPGPPDSAFRQRFVARWAARLVRRLAAEAGVARLAVRSRPGAVTEQLVVAYPWRSSGRAEALGEAVAEVLDALAAGTRPDALDPVLAAAGVRVRSAPRGGGRRC